MLSDRSWKRLFVGLALGRLLSLFPLIIDDDEAWWTVAARSLSSPFEYYFRAVDHKPPGIVWFIESFASDPRLARLFFSVFAALAALALGKLSFWFREKSRGVDWKAACFFLFALAIGSPKLLTVTADGVLVLFVVAGYFIALTSEWAWASILSGALLGCALLMKQTAVFFALPVLFSNYPRRWHFREILGFFLGATLVYVPAVWLMDWREFFYWNWTYPREVLTRARGSAFHSYSDMLSNSFQFVMVLLPLCYFALRSRASRRDFRVLWLISAALGTFLGKGIFLHYFLLLAPPLALLAAEGWSQKRFALAWLITGYVFACIVIAFPFSGLFWGNDALYAEVVGRKMDLIGETIHDHSAMVWGGSSLSLAYSRATYPGRFLLPRFAEPPYDTSRTQEIFHREFEANLPALIVDLHERGDNRFNNELETDPLILVNVRRGYSLYVDPTIPWAKFYLKKSLSEQDQRAVHLEAVVGKENFSRVYTKFPAHPGEWQFWKKDRYYRVSNALELVGNLSQDVSVRTRARELSPDSLEAEIFLKEQSTGQLMLPLLSPLWWPEVAIVELQPKLY